MSVVTIEGRLGAGAPDLGRIVAKELGLDFIDRLLLADIAKRVGSTMGALSDQERRVPTLTNRFAQSIQRMLHRSAVAGMGGDPYFGPGIEHLLARPYSEMEEPPHTNAEEIDEQHFIDTAIEVITDLAEIGNVVILGRGGADITRQPKSTTGGGGCKIRGSCVTCTTADAPDIGRRGSINYRAHR